MEWSKYQQDIFDAVVSSNDSLVVEAVAGSGKTTTLVEIINRIPEGMRACFVAFNKSIQLQLAARVNNPNARCMTMHAVGWSSWRTALGWDAGTCRLDSGKVRDIMSQQLSWPDRMKYGANTTKLIALAKGNGLVPRLAMSNGFYKGLVEDMDSNWEAMMELHNLDPLTCSIPMAREILAQSIYQSREVCDYDDQLYMPIISGCLFEQYDVVLLDEAQDVNSLQIEMVNRMVKSDGRLIAVGDRHQAIYGFRGALADCMDIIEEKFSARHLPLSISYRCPKLVVQHSQVWVPQIEYAEAAPDGVLELHDPEKVWEAKNFRPSDVILCRLNKPLVTLAFSLLRKRVACRIAGRDIGKNLVDLVKQMKASSMSELEERLGQWRQAQIKRAKGDEGKISGINDRVDTLLVFIDQNIGVSPEVLIREIEGMFVDPEPGKPQNILLLSTVHKAKGGEWDRVFVLDARDFMPIPWAKEGWQQQQEQNLMYVAATRAKMELRYISSEGIR